ncbi:hypothetical protein GLOIN_2v1843016 [Rhizophagus irregularis DAOM 181602=DAOM 197198]|uniref:Serine-enriched protein n=3 Tax=Rhizophagus irregularis TaxID=588596 RepID=A0A015JBD4_RHIIW|nr:hypothetical protein GLOIN_2v1843016 [Rhizophagus irregularis DAOM 181602=DAOM 197198]EXX64220.1 hypothetical protein RirG_144850 [Rhizophagus irregularis DAOM 197198w]POG68377.1 hypothetical protein GLOIN_2v1843016 [Rhizophagus irregularis DAOM 181602=DAOM 197198]GBC22005.1 hypothetical protein GLOIN_2v1843016 [Rhizophagus irregularis DAOM 181602=DAOM 197198]|eukprot:XP_025175243.1 hypothetical protein GLOIN_2v1843016 [Rhizophagus irregularis DAOM 181602=DAOM 197198]
MASIFHLNLSKDLSLLLDYPDDYNVIIQVGENQNTKEFRTHSVILRARSSYFKSALSSNWIRKKDNMIIFSKPDLTPTCFDMILRYIYTGEFDLTKQSGENILDLLVASDELLFEELFRHVQDYLIEERLDWIHENSALVLNAVFRLDNCKKLQDCCLKFICKNTLLFLSSKSFPSLNKEILFDLLKIDDLQIEEIIIWDHLIKWGINQNPGLVSDKAKWNNENYEALKKTLNQFIPLIRLVGISRVDIFDKVLPYKTIIPKHIYEDIEEFHYKSVIPKIIILPPRTGSLIKSNIIEPILAKIIINWIDKKDTMYTRTINDPLYKLELIYLNIRDGFSNKSFRNKCNGRMANLVLIKVKQSNKIFGGYSPIGFSSLGESEEGYFVENNGRFYNSSNNFIFSFEHNSDNKYMKISRVVNSNKAIFDNRHCGFDFGMGSLCMSGYTLYVNNYNENYENNLNIRAIYTIAEIETFNVEDYIKK